MGLDYRVAEFIEGRQGRVLKSEGRNVGVR